MAAADLIIVLVVITGFNRRGYHYYDEEGSLQEDQRSIVLEEHRGGIGCAALGDLPALSGPTCSVVTRESVERCALVGEVLDKVRAVHIGKAFLCSDVWFTASQLSED